MWDLPGSGLKPKSPALAGGFLTTEPPGKPPKQDSYWSILGNWSVLSVSHQVEDRNVLIDQPGLWVLSCAWVRAGEENRNGCWESRDMLVTRSSSDSPLGPPWFLDGASVCTCSVLNKYLLSEMTTSFNYFPPSSRWRGGSNLSSGILSSLRSVNRIKRTKFCCLELFP